MENENKENLESTDFETDENIDTVEDVENIELSDEIDSDETIESPFGESAFDESVDEKTETVIKAKKVKADVKPKAKKSNSATMVLIGLLVLVLAGMAFGFYKYNSGLSGYQPVTKIEKSEIEALIKDADPMMLKQMAGSPEEKKKLADNFQNIFAIANQANKDGLGTDANSRRELANLETETVALSYDKQLNKDAGNAPPFGLITEEQVNNFWNGTDGSQGIMDSIGLGGNSAAAREAAFDSFLDTKITMLKESNTMPQERQITDEERKQARDYFAKTRIYYNEAKQKGAELGDEFWQKANFQIKLQQAQFMARLYSQKILEDKLKVTDEDVAAYLQAHPELDNSEAKKKQAEEILEKAKGGEDFAELAKTYSDDPGSKEKGGLYENVNKGMMQPEFENAALALEPGKITDKLVETPFGYHIIKLIKKGTKKGDEGKEEETYDVRHILIGTGIKDPENPVSRPMPPKEFAKAQLQKEKQEKVLEEIKANNPVEVPEDFTVPEVNEEELKKQMQQQMLQPPPGAPQPQPQSQPQPSEK